MFHICLCVSHYYLLSTSSIALHFYSFTFLSFFFEQYHDSLRPHSFPPFPLSVRPVAVVSLSSCVVFFFLSCVISVFRYTILFVYCIVSLHFVAECLLLTLPLIRKLRSFVFCILRSNFHNVPFIRLLAATLRITLPLLSVSFCFRCYPHV